MYSDQDLAKDVANDVLKFTAGEMSDLTLIVIIIRRIQRWYNGE